MKICFKCNIKKPLTDFYKHKNMGDGFLNKCKLCTKKDVKERADKLSLDPKWMEAERSRSREKYHRLGYKENQKEWDKNKPWKKTQVYKNLNRNLNTPKGYELHHWNYNKDFLEDVVLMDIKSHRRLHKLIELDIEKRIFKEVKTGKYLFSKLDHCAYIIEKGFEFLTIHKK